LLRRGGRDGAGGGDGRDARCDWLIVGLGNPGSEHAQTRHNVGFMVADLLAERWGLGRARERYRGRIAEGRLPASVPAMEDSEARPRVALLWPETYMNEAGRSVGPARGALRVPLNRVLVVHDEIDIPFGDIRPRLGGGLAGHNGLKSLRRELGGPEFARVRVGVGRPESSDPEIVSAYVLGRFRESPADVRDLIERAADAVQRVVLGRERL
jgi:peptidyl-tRNA hydrolase, PTH1 family